MSQTLRLRERNESIILLILLINKSEISIYKPLSIYVRIRVIKHMIHINRLSFNQFHDDDGIKLHFFPFSFDLSLSN